MQDTETLSLTDAETLLFEALVASGTLETAARSTAKALVAAEAEGQVGHGFSRLADYSAQVRSGKVNGAAVPTITQDGTAAFTVDAAHGFAYPALDLALENGIDTAKTTGTAAIGITRSHHCGALSVQVARVADAGCIAMMVANTPKAIAPWGAKKPVFGTNPIAFAAPLAGSDPLVIDLSLSRVARGKVMHAKKTGQKIPEGWALDKTGAPTTDPDAALQGSMVPIGEAKGTALAFMIEVLASTFTGASPSAEMASFFSADGPPPNAGQFLLVLRPAQMSAFADRMVALSEGIEALEGARLPGTRRADALRRAQAEGLRVPKTYVSLARQLAKSGTVAS